jgi:hypothetical protein
MLLPKRHPIKALGVFAFMVRDQGVGGSNPLSPTNYLEETRALKQRPATADFPVVLDCVQPDSSG